MDQPAFVDPRDTEGSMPALCRPCSIRIKAPPTSHHFQPLRIPCPLPHCPSAPPDTPKLEVQVSPREATVREGESVTMTCQVISSHPEYWHVWWLKDGTLLSRERTFSLTLPRVTRQMSGKYQCQAQNAIGSGISEGVDLKVHCEPPRSWGGGRAATQTLGREALEASAHFLLPTPTLCFFCQMLQNLPGFRSSPHQLRKEIKYS